MECAQVTEEQRLWTETQIQKAKHNAWPSCLASVYLTNPPVAESRLKPLLKQLSPVRSTWSKEYGRRRFDAACISHHAMLSEYRISNLELERANFGVLGCRDCCDGLGMLRLLRWF